MGAFLLNHIELVHISKIYQSEDGNITNALNDVSISFPMHGLVAIIGKSGSGKTTLINILACLDKPTKGEILVNGKKRKKKINQTSDFGIVFQHYYLLDNETVLFNVMLPALILGQSKKNSKQKAISFLESIDFPKELYNHKCSDLSGGEKERVALLRALINDPPILLCDEPTGALDSNNSIKIMEILKAIAKDRLVVVVSHNLALTYEYADRVITLKDGKVIEDKTINKLQETAPKPNKRKKSHHNQWSNKITTSNFKKRFARNVISIVSLFIGLLFSLLIIGFSNGSSDSIIRNSYHQLDYGVATISHEYSEEIVGSKMSLVKQTRPSLDSLNTYQNLLNKYEIENNFDALIPPSITIKLGEERLDNFAYKPIYSFLGNYFDKSLLTNGYLPGSDNLNEVVVNKKAYEYLKKQSNIDPLKIVLEGSFAREFHYQTRENDNPTVSDVFSYKKYFHIVGVVDEMDFLNTPRIYYSYLALVDYLFDYPVNNLSTYLERKVSWYERVATANNNEDLSSYSLRLFLKDINDKKDIKNDIASIEEPLVLESTPYSLSNTLLDLVNAATMGMEIFLIIALFGTALILGIVSFSSYSEDRKIIAILTVLGAKRDAVMDIYIFENLIIAFFGLFLSFAASPFLALLANKIIFNITGFDNMIRVPFIEMSPSFLFTVLIIIISTIALAIISTSLPIVFSGKISLKKELADE